MTATAPQRGSSVIPCMRYQDAPAAIDWLCNAFGFERRAVFPGENGIIAHAELTYGTGMIMLGSNTESEFGRFVKTPADLGGRCTFSPYVVISDIHAHHAKSLAAGAKIAMPPKDEGHGWSYSCFDPEGHLWFFGTYDPWSAT